MIKEHVELNFNPENYGDEIKRVFADDLARTLWLGIRPSHLASPDFDRLVLNYAQIISDEMSTGQLTADKLLGILSGVARPPAEGIIGPSERKFAEELLPFVSGEKKITFTIVAEKLA